MANKRGQRLWKELSPDEQNEFKLHYICTRDVQGAAAQANLSPHSARQITVNHGLNELADRADALTRERLVTEAADWKEHEIARLDESMDWLVEVRKAGQVKRPDFAASYDKLLRAKLVLLGEADSRQEVSHSGSVDTSSGNLGEVLRILVEAGALESEPGTAPDTEAE